jgi:lipopolysaccharide assembly protein A
MRLFFWLFWAFIFFTLFAFALNNQHAATVHWFFGMQWRTPMVFVVLLAFAAGCAIGVLGMVPSWWRHRRVAKRSVVPTPVPAAKAKPSSDASPPTSVMPSEFVQEHPPRDGV